MERQRAVRNLAVGILAFSGAAALVPTGSEAATPNCKVQINVIGSDGSGRTVRAETPQGVKITETSLVNGRGVLTWTLPSNDTKNGRDAYQAVLRNGTYAVSALVACGSQADQLLKDEAAKPSATTVTIPTATVTVRANTPTPKSEPTVTSTATVTVRANTPTPKSEPTVTSTPDSRAAVPAPASTQDSNNSWLGVVLVGLGLAALTGAGALAYRARNRHPNQHDNPNVQGVFVPVRFIAPEVVIGFTPNLQNPNNPTPPVVPGAPTQPMPPTQNP